MTSTPWQYTDAARRTVFYTDGAGAMHSALVSSPEVQAWIAAGNAPAAPPAPSLADQAGAMLAAGCQIASTSTPALNGTYACDPASQSKVQAIALYIQVNGKFPAGKSALPWIDAAGAVHTFNTTAEFLAFATATGDFVTEIEMIMLGQSSTLPVQPAQIA